MTQIIELLTRTLCDTSPDTITDGAFLFGQTPDNQESVFQRAYQLLNEGFTRNILFADTPPISGYPGFTIWKEQLIQRGLPREQIIGVPVKEKSILHTLIEAEAVISFAKENRFQSLYIVASPFQQLRGFMTAVTVALRIYPEIKLYGKPGYPLSWQDEVTHSQGKVTGTRSTLIAGELARISTYQQKGDLASVDAILGYLNSRDG